MLNFYLRLITPSDEFAPQYKLQEIESPEPPTEPHYYSHAVDEFLDAYIVLDQTGTSKGLNDVFNSDTPLSLTGHSLGGHLASEFALLFPNAVTETVTFNSAGFILHENSSELKRVA
jgi:pimeloyl-ACP methyl ester carboxylesterase